MRDRRVDAAAEPSPGSATAAAAIASTAFLLPLVLSIGANPAPTNPRVLAWYASLRKPAFKPPDAVIPMAWTVIEGALAVGGYRLWRAPASPERHRSLGLWAFNVAMIGGWSRLFFRRRNLPLSTAAAAAMVGTGLAYVAEADRVDRTAGAAGWPFVGWIAFATVLTGAIWRLNRR